MKQGNCSRVLRLMRRGVTSAQALAKSLRMDERAVRTYLTRLRRRGHIRAERIACEHCGCKHAAYFPVQP